MCVRLTLSEFYNCSFFKIIARKQRLELISNYKMNYSLPASRTVGITVLESMSCLLLNALALVGNTLICAAVYRNKRLRTTTNLYIIALAISDLLSAIFVMPMASGSLIAGRWIFGVVGCEIHAFVSLFAIYVSPTTMGLTAFNRYVRIVKTNVYHKVFSPLRSRILLGSVWLFVACYISVPRICGWQRWGFIPGYMQCSTVHLSDVGRYIHYVVIVSLFFLCPLCTSLVCYYKVFKTISRHNLDIAPSLQNRVHVARVSVQEIRVSKSLSVVVFAFMLCWAPFWIIVIVKRFSLVENLPRNVELFCMFCFYLSNAINPIIYSGMNPAFRKEVFSLLLSGRGRLVCRSRRGVSSGQTDGEVGSTAL